MKFVSSIKQPIRSRADIQYFDELHFDTYKENFIRVYNHNDLEWKESTNYFIYEKNNHFGMYVSDGFDTLIFASDKKYDTLYIVEKSKREELPVHELENNKYFVIHNFIDNCNYSMSFSSNLKIDEKVIEDYNLIDLYPNPFNSHAIIEYNIISDSNVEIKVYNILGEKVQTILNEQKIKGLYSFNWNAANLPSGIYWLNIKTNFNQKSIKCTLLK